MRIQRNHFGSKSRFLTLAGLLASCLLLSALAACGSEKPEPSTAPDYERALSGAPAPLAALYDQAGQLLGGGKQAYEERIAELNGEGYPAVVNIWASWCGPCILEIPHFQRVAARLGKRVAFLGINSQDAEDSASTFLRDNPLPYPSYLDPDKKIHTSVGALYLPATVFYDRKGETYTKQGYYSSDRELMADIRRYALGQKQ
jgi:cytochrome c biogenesis protein CcmG/thiol:disulfide interchange protein DsbE